MLTLPDKEHIVMKAITIAVDAAQVVYLLMLVWYAIQ